MIFFFDTLGDIFSPGVLMLPPAGSDHTADKPDERCSDSGVPRQIPAFQNHH